MKPFTDTEFIKECTLVIVNEVGPEKKLLFDNIKFWQSVNFAISLPWLPHQMVGIISHQSHIASNVGKPEVGYSWLQILSSNRRINRCKC